MATQPPLANNRVQVVCHDHKASDRSREGDAGACEFPQDTNTIYDRINHLPRAATRGNSRHGEKTVGSTRGEVPARVGRGAAHSRTTFFSRAPLERPERNRGVMGYRSAGSLTP